MSQFDYIQSKNPKNELLAVALSFAAQFIQLVLIVMGATAQASFVSKYFVYSEVITLSTIVNLVISLALVGIISYWQKNNSFAGETNSKVIAWIRQRLLLDPSKRSYFFDRAVSKRWMLVGGTVLIVSSVLFVLATVSHLARQDIWFVNSINTGIIQILSYMSLWVLTTVILFVWISFELEKSNQFRQEDFFPNFSRSLQNQGYLRQPKIMDNLGLNNSNHLIYCNLQDEDKYFVVSYDGKSIIKEITREESDLLFPPLSQESDDNTCSKAA